MELGDMVKDKVSGFIGVAVARLESLYEVTQYRVHPKSLQPDNGQPTPFVWLEEGRLEVLEDMKFVGFKLVKGEQLGGK